MFPIVESRERDPNGSQGAELLGVPNSCSVVQAASVVSHIPHAPSKVSVTEGDINSANSSVPSFISNREANRLDHREGSSSYASSIRSLPPYESSAPRESRSREEDALSGTRRTVSLDESGPAAKKHRIHHSKTPQSLMYIQEEEEEEGALQQPTAVARKSTNVLLLARPNDDMVLSPLHVFVRQQVEVFTATESDISQPAPGRKNRIQLGQVGLRCIHCRDLPPRDRVKRAVCYPSSVGRVYHSVSDMKFDHFSHCKGRSADVKLKFQELKDDCKQKRHKKSLKTPIYSSSSTAQYYHDSACEMGMVDGPGGLFMLEDVSMLNSDAYPSFVSLESNMAPPGATMLPQAMHPGYAEQDDSMNVMNNMMVPLGMDARTGVGSFAALDDATKNVMMSSLASYLYSMNSTNHLLNGMQALSTRTEVVAEKPAMNAAGSCLLTSPMDQYHLNPLHCFVRRHIEVFVADKDDIAAPAPGRKTRVTLGQVGLRCVHCAALPMKDRVKRAVCYPAAVAGVYHSVSNMKFDHFDKCRGLPDHERAIFVSLRSTCGRHGPRNGGTESGGSKGVPNTNSTAQYYQESATAMGLVDSENGIRLQDPPKLPESSAAAIDYKSGSFKSTKKLFPRSLLKKNPHHHADFGSPLSPNAGATDGISALMIAASVRVAVAADAGETSRSPTARREEIV